MGIPGVNIGTQRIVPSQKDEIYDVISLKIGQKILLKFCILNSLMLLIMCTKFQINQIILTLFSGLWDKNPTPVAEKVVKCRRQ